MPSDKQFTQKIYFGYMHGVGSALMVPCPHNKPCKVGSLYCRGCVDFGYRNDHEQYVVCKKKPELLDALELVRDHCGVCKNIPAVNDTISGAYGEKS
jgi:hypothetical protein